jgi:hypothetical protein
MPRHEGRLRPLIVASPPHGGFDGRLTGGIQDVEPDPCTGRSAIQRGRGGRFAPGNRGGPRRLKEFTAEKEKFAEAMRREVARRKLAPERMGMMAAEAVRLYLPTP